MSYKGNSGLDKALKGTRKNPLIDDIITKGGLAEFLGCTPETITYYQKEYGLPFIPVGRDTYFSTRSVHKWFMSRQVNHNGHKPEPKKRGMTETSNGGEIGAN